MSCVLEIEYQTRWDPLEIKIPNPYRTMRIIIARILGDDVEIESQLFHSEFVHVALVDGYGDKYVYGLEYLFDYASELTVVYHGAISDSNHTHIMIKEWFGGGYPGGYHQPFTHGIMDSSPRSVTILTDRTADFMQANKNQYEAQMSSFRENQDQLNRQIGVNTDSVDLQNRVETYNADYALTTADLNVGRTARRALNDRINSGLGVGQMAMGAIAGGTFSERGLGPAAGALGVAAGALQFAQGWQYGDWAQDDSRREAAKAQQSVAYVGEGNALRSQQNNVAALGAKLAQSQALRAFNASLKDLQNAPDSIQRAGSDLSFQVGNTIDGIKLLYELPTSDMLKEANMYLQAFGPILNVWDPNVFNRFNIRERFVYIKTSGIQLKVATINQNHLRTLEEMFNTGVRVWDFSRDDIYETFGDTTVQNRDK